MAFSTKYGCFQDQNGQREERKTWTEDNTMAQRTLLTRELKKTQP